MRELLLRVPDQVAAREYHTFNHAAKIEKLAEMQRATEQRIQDERAAKEAVVSQKKLREAKAAEAELEKKRVCTLCGQSFRRVSNKPGKCAHVGSWVCGAKDDKGMERLYLMHWDCCDERHLQSYCIKSGRHQEA
mmetsp:Transcript_6330/g.13868  ORF Transcript_6330/g.13868 Transcript_6330/m.13868 type:complete len:135 (-) Transcript_6330:150-554(-)